MGKKNKKAKHNRLPAAVQERLEMPTRDGFDELRRRANGGDAAAQAELRRILDAHPDIWQNLGDLAAHTQLTLVRHIAEGEFLVSEAIHRKADQMRRDLAGAFPTPLEVVAVERVVATWLYLQYIEGKCDEADGELERAKVWLKRQEQANRVYHAAVKSLMTVRELQPIAGLGKDAARRRQKVSTPVAKAVPVNRISGLAKERNRRELASV